MKTEKLVLLNDTFDEEWDDFVYHHPDGTLFHTTKWLKCCVNNQSADMFRLGFLANDKLIGICPIFIKWFGLIKVVASPMVVEDTPFMGPLVKQEECFADFLEAIEKWIRNKHVNFSRIILSDRTKATLYTKSGYFEMIRHTHVLDLSQGKEEVWKNMKSNARNHIRKAEKNDVQYHFSEDPHHLEKYYQLAKILYMSQGKVIPNSKTFYNEICFGQLSTNSKLLIAEHDNKIIAAAILVYFKDQLYYLDAVSDKQFLKFRAPSGMQWFIIQWAIDNGFKYYDFVGSDMPWIAKFKAGFGGELHEYSLFEKASPQWIFALRSLYGKKINPLVQKIKSQVPLWK
ncbi:lipid II:glycine glycyltransferase FemX [Thermodesulfobacteriota bacterium]